MYTLNFQRQRASKFVGWLALLGVFLLGGCASIVGSVTGGLASNLSAALLNSDDPAMIRDGAPSYLILIDFDGISHVRVNIRILVYQSLRCPEVAFRKYAVMRAAGSPPESFVAQS